MDSEVKWMKTHCARMDHGGCALLAAVKDGRIVEIKGDPKGYLNKGYTCYKGRVSADRLYSPGRLQYPLRRTGPRGSGGWQRISWQEALDETAGRLLEIKKEFGARAVGFGLGMPKGLEHFIQIRLANAFGSPNVIASQDVCHAPREVTGLHTCGFYPVADLHNPTELLVSWASNVIATNEEGQIGSLALNQIKKGARLLVADPRRTELAERADLWLQFRPGTSQALTLGLINVIIEESLYDKEFVSGYTYGFEELASKAALYTPEMVESITWVDRGLIREAARMYAAARPAAIQWGNGIEHDVNVFDATRSLVCLMAICGNLETPGGNINAHDPDIMGLGKFVRSDLVPDKAKTMIGYFHQTIPRLMTVPPSYFRQAALTGNPYPMRGYFGVCTNPMVAWADSPATSQAFHALSFVAVSDLVMTPTAAMADIVFPAAHHFEINDIGHYGLGHGMILARPRLVDPPGECWPDMKIMTELGKRISPPELWPENHEQFLEDLLAPSGMSYRQFVEIGFLKGPDLFRSYEDKGFKTPTGKVELMLSNAAKYGLKPLPEYTGLPMEETPEYPLILISAKSKNYLLSSYRWVDRLRSREPLPTVEIHPDTARDLGISEGDQVTITSPYGSIRQYARLTSIVHPRVVCAALGWWYPEGDPAEQYDWRESNFNMLTSMKILGREFGTPNIKDLPCRVSRA